MFAKLAGVVARFDDIERQLIAEGLTPDELKRLSKEHANIEDLVRVFRRHQSLISDRETAQAMLDESDPETRAFAKEELDQLSEAIAATEKELLVLSLPTDRNDTKNVIVEVRAGTGGEEAALFAADLFRMYKRYADRQGWRAEILSSTESATGGFKEIIMLIEGQKVYSRLKFESGVHRVQRVPATEAQGRIHTSACTVAILPEADEVEVNIDAKDLDIMVCRSSGAGGQHVNTTDSAVRIVHKPTGLVVECQDERSQIKNRERALKILKARLLEKAQTEQDASRSAMRKTMVGSGDRSERIRTYNFPQGRMTDHRINLTMYSLSDILDGDIGKVLDALGAAHQAELLKSEHLGTKNG